jgi:hypothetical protein
MMVDDVGLLVQFAAAPTIAVPASFTTDTSLQQRMGTRLTHAKKQWPPPLPS